MANTVEEKEAQQAVAAAEAEAQQQIDEAGKAAQAEAENEGLSEEAVMALVEKARTEEKDKLYPKIQELTDQVKELTEHNRQQQAEKEQADKEAQEKAERARQSKLTDEQRQTEILQRIEEQLQQTQSRATELEEKLDRKERQQQLDKYREEAIRAVPDGKLITELVYGNNETEIDAAIIRAKARYEEIEKNAREERGQQIRGQMSGTSPGHEALEEEELEQRLPNVDEDRYLSDPAYRAKVQETLANEYARLSGRS